MSSWGSSARTGHKWKLVCARIRQVGSPLQVARQLSQWALQYAAVQGSHSYGSALLLLEVDVLVPQ